ncbi:MAG: serine/threonine protein kinase [Bdellovibrionales bacterium]|nr:serine/threonine protein kinase [Bdellovibrionales bacterium]
MSIFIALFIATPAYASCVSLLIGKVSHGTAQLLVRIQEATQDKSSTSWLLQHKYGVNKSIAHWIEERDQSLKEYRWRRKGQDPKVKVTFAGEEYQILAQLGHGYEGDVYLIDFDNRLAVLKEFKAGPGAENQVQVMSEIRKHGILVPEVLGVEENQLLLEYTEGYPMDQVIDRYVSLTTPGVVDEYFQTEEKWRALKIFGFSPKPSNVIFSLKLNQFVVIDVF